MSDLYDRYADTWWDERGFLHGLRTLLNPVRVPYIRGAVRALVSGTPRILDLGCGGGLLAEDLTSLGTVLGLDPSLPSIAAAAAHARANDREVRYVAAVGEAIPLADEAVDVVVCSEVLEHVDDPDRVVAEAARVLRSGGLFIYSGPNRTRLSRILLVQAPQDWLGVLPKNLHIWDRFVTASELTGLMQHHGIEPLEHVGVGLPLRSVPSAIGAILRARLGRVSYPQAGRAVRLTTTRRDRLAYLGYGRRVRPRP
jgi:2-polyprenyl-6-hydroxyphenyl methylase/3-demethylubiquinone-9 3-methyltransferase